MAADVVHDKYSQALRPWRLVRPNDRLSPPSGSRYCRHRNSAEPDPRSSSFFLFLPVQTLARPSRLSPLFARIVVATPPQCRVLLARDSRPASYRRKMPRASCAMTPKDIQTVVSKTLIT